MLERICDFDILDGEVIFTPLIISALVLCANGLAATHPTSLFLLFPALESSAQLMPCTLSPTDTPEGVEGEKARLRTSQRKQGKKESYCVVL